MPDSAAHTRAARPARPSDALVLAAVERAGRHQANNGSAVPVWAILEHLELRPRSPGARHVRTRLGALQAAGALECTRRHSVPTWELTHAGRRLLRRAASAGELRALPESPQHRAWRNARTAAAQELERFRELLRERLEHGAALLDADPPPHSDAWFELAEELQRGCRRVASASHCLYEWNEPDDARADLDAHVEPDDRVFAPAQRELRRARRGGRRNILLWDGGADG
jgi:hypothetical protein